MVRRFIYISVLVLVGVVGWIFWAEMNPEEEKGLRHYICEEAGRLFPEGMQNEVEEFGLFHRVPVEAPDEVVVLIHGLDEPGDIWNELVEHWAEKPIDIWEFRYPNDQSVSDSVLLLGREWRKLPPKQRYTLIGHSMGGLVSRAFLGTEEGAKSVSHLIMLGTPNQGSEWARFRSWLELRDHFPTEERRTFSLFASLRDGCGEAKIDLRPGSVFLNQLNARRLNAEIEVLTVAGVIGREWIDMQIEAQGSGKGATMIREVLEQLRLSSEGLGDGVVPYESTQVAGFPVPLIVNASHRGMIHNLLEREEMPPAIPLIDQFLGL